MTKNNHIYENIPEVKSRRTSPRPSMLNVAMCCTPKEKTQKVSNETFVVRSRAKKTILSAREELRRCYNNKGNIMLLENAYNSESIIADVERCRNSIYTKNEEGHLQMIKYTALDELRGVSSGYDADYDNTLYSILPDMEIKEHEEAPGEMMEKSSSCFPDSSYSSFEDSITIRDIKPLPLGVRPPCIGQEALTNEASTQLPMLTRKHIPSNTEPHISVKTNRKNIRSELKKKISKQLHFFKKHTTEMTTLAML